MVAIARALLLNPKLLTLDEPSQGVAPLVVREVFRIVAQMREERISFLLVEQDVQSKLPRRKRRGFWRAPSYRGFGRPRRAVA